MLAGLFGCDFLVPLRLDYWMDGSQQQSFLLTSKARNLIGSPLGPFRIWVTHVSSADVLAENHGWHFANNLAPSFRTKSAPRVV